MKEKNNGTTKQKIINKMTLVSHYISIITLNVNELCFLIQRERMARWIKKDNNMLPTRDFRIKSTHQLKVEGWKNIFYENGGQKRSGVSIDNTRSPRWNNKAIKEIKGIQIRNKKYN